MAQWSIGLEAEGDRVFEREEVVALADAVAGDGGIATGIGTTRYGAQLLVQASSEEEAVETARSRFTAAARTAGLPSCPIVRVEVEQG